MVEGKTYINISVLGFGIVVLFLMVGQVALAHEAEVNSSINILQLNKIAIVTYTSIILILLSVGAVVLKPKLNNLSEKLIFILFALIIVGVTFYLDFSIIYTNIISVTHGPIHWHAQISFMICGKEYSLAHREIAVDKPMHVHADEIIHVETTPLSYQEVQLSKFFEYIGGEFTKTSLSFPADSGTISVKNGDICYGKPGTLKMLVNGKPEPKMEEYAISPVEAGNIDKIVVEFD